MLFRSQLISFSSLLSPHRSPHIHIQYETKIAISIAPHLLSCRSHPLLHIPSATPPTSSPCDPTSTPLRPSPLLSLLHGRAVSGVLAGAAQAVAHEDFVRAVAVASRRSSLLLLRPRGAATGAARSYNRRVAVLQSAQAVLEPASGDGVILCWNQFFFLLEPTPIFATTVCWKQLFILLEPTPISATTVFKFCWKQFFILLEQTPISATTVFKFCWN